MWIGTGESSCKELSLVVVTKEQYIGGLTLNAGDVPIWLFRKAVHVIHLMIWY